MIAHELRRIAAILLGGVVLLNTFTSAFASISVSGNLDPAYTGDDPWEVSEPLEVGAAGDGQMTVSGSSHVSSTHGVIGKDAGTTGIVTITGPDAAWANRYAMTVGRYGHGELNLLDGGVIGYGGVVFSAFEGSSSNVLVSGAGSRLNTLYTVLVGQEGPSTLTVENSGLLTSNNGWIAGLKSSTSSVLVSGPGSTWTATGEMQAGRFGNGSLTIEAGGVVTCGAGAYVGYGYSAVGYALVTGEGSLWGGNGASDLYVGNAGVGTLDVTDHAEVNQRMGYVGYYADAIGIVNVSDHSALNISGGILMVGYSGEAHINVSGGSLLYCHGARIGYEQESVGQVTLSGAESRWIDTRELVVGEAGQGQLLVENGATLETHLYGITLGQDPGSRGELVVSGAGSSISSGDDLVVGESGVGSVGIGPLSHVEVFGDVFIGKGYYSEGTLNVTGGSLSLHGGRLVAGGGIANFSFLSGELRGVGSINLKAPFVQNGGTFAPADGIGLTDIFGDYEINGGTVGIEIGGEANTSDQVNVSGNIDISLTGTIMDLQAVGPVISGTYTVIESLQGTLTGQFEHITGLAMYEGLIDVAYTSNAVMVTLNWDYVPGDLNADGFVSLDDLDTLLLNWNQNVGLADLSSGDISGDGYIGLDDLDVLLQNWNSGSAPPTQVLEMVPEPATICMCGFGMTILSRRRSA